jgi:hypothetical protein
MKRFKHLNKIVKVIRQKKMNKNMNENMNETPNEISWNTPKEKRNLKTSWKINIKKNK